MPGERYGVAGRVADETVNGRVEQEQAEGAEGERGSEELGSVDFRSEAERNQERMKGIRADPCHLWLKRFLFVAPSRRCVRLLERVGSGGKRCRTFGAQEGNAVWTWVGVVWP
jgi:hypothetical protein